MSKLPGAAPATDHDEGSPRVVISGLNRTAFDLAVYASQGWSPTHHARLASGCWSGSTGRDWLPAGFHLKGFKLPTILLSRAFFARGQTEFQVNLKLGLTPRSSRAGYTAKHLHEKKCYESRDPIEEWSEAIRELKVTSLGKYHINSLAHNFQYIDAISVDTPILDDSVRQSVKDCFTIRERLTRSRQFLEYLNGCGKSLQDARAKQIWGDVYSTAKAAMIEIGKGIDERPWHSDWEPRPFRKK